MKYRKKSEIIEAVKWDGNIETIQKNKWLEDAIKEDKVVLCMNDIYDKEPVLLVSYGSKSLRPIVVGSYVVKESRDKDYIIYEMEAEEIKKEFEYIEEAKMKSN